MKPKLIVKGFTLVELLLGLTIGAIIAVSVYNLFWSAIRLDDKMRRIHDAYLEILMAQQALSHDLENAITLDFSLMDPNSIVFDGKNESLSFLTQTSQGIKRVRYYSGIPQQGEVTKVLIGRIINPSEKITVSSKETMPIEFLMRDESSLGVWLKKEKSKDNILTQVVAAGLAKGSFNCRYAAQSPDLHAAGAKSVVYEERWNRRELPLSVSCSFRLYDPRHPEGGLMFKRDMFLAPLAKR